MPAHGVLHYFVILSSAEKYANAWILMRPFSVAVKGVVLQIIWRKSVQVIWRTRLSL